MSGKMKAWTYTHGGYAKALQQSWLPSGLGPLKSTEIRVRVKTASINPVDVQLMGFPLWTYLPEFVVAAHKGVGEDFSGEVQEAGTASGFRPGDEVFGITPFIPGGTLQETIEIDTKTPLALPLVCLTAQTAIAKAEPYVRNGKIAILGGSSSSGMYAVYLAKKRGWIAIASCSGRNADFVRNMGASDTIDYTTTSVLQAVKAFSPDVIIVRVGGIECLGIARRYVTIVGDKTNRLSMGGRNTYLRNPQMLLRALLGRAGLGHSYTCVNLEFKQYLLEEALSLHRDDIIIDSTFGFDRVREAFERLDTGRTRGKVVVDVAV